MAQIRGADPWRRSVLIGLMGGAGCGYARPDAGLMGGAGCVRVRVCVSRCGLVLRRVGVRRDEDIRDEEWGRGHST